MTLGAYGRSFMAKRKRVLTQKIIDEKIKKGHGAGRLADYKPWLNIQLAKSNGLVSRINGWKTGRQHDLLSKLKLNYFYLLEWSESVIDIRETFPLDLRETIAIAEQLGIKHSIDNRSKNKNEIPITTDFLITVKKLIGTQDYARTVVYGKSLTKKYLPELEIQRRYWQLRNIDWGIVTEQEINEILALNIEWVHPYLNVESLNPLTSEQFQEVTSYLKTQLTSKNQKLNSITTKIDRELNLKMGSTLSVVRHLIARKELEVNMLKPIDISEPLCLSGGI
jgi:hypothetical protein